MKDHQLHIPVLINEVLEQLAPKPGETLLDATAGYGGHSSAILEKTGQAKGSVLVDRDQNAVKVLNERFMGTDAEIVHTDFAKATQELQNANRRFDLILADLGVSSPHLNNASRGFSFQTEGPLDMRMDTSTGLTAADIVNTSSADSLSDILTTYGEEPRARKIAEAIVEHRPIDTTTQLAEIVTVVYGGRGRYKVHPATKTFQALRLAVNDELAQLRYALPIWLEMLVPGGRIAIISFHSLEDRIVKEVMSEHGGNRYDATIQILTKKPVVASKDELVLNPRARSAKLRAAVKIKTERDAHANSGKR